MVHTKRSSSENGNNLAVYQSPTGMNQKYANNGYQSQSSPDNGYQSQSSSQNDNNLGVYQSVTEINHQLNLSPEQLVHTKRSSSEKSNNLGVYQSVGMNREYVNNGYQSQSSPDNANNLVYQSATGMNHQSNQVDRNSERFVHAQRSLLKNSFDDEHIPVITSDEEAIELSLEICGL